MENSEIHIVARYQELIILHEVSNIFAEVQRSVRVILLILHLCFRARVKSGIKILDASSSSPDWIVVSDVNAKNTVATFVARRKENTSRVSST